MQASRESQEPQEQYVAISQEPFLCKIQQFIEELKIEYKGQMNELVDSIDKILIPFGLFIEFKKYTFEQLIECIKQNLKNNNEEQEIILVNQKIILILFYYIFKCDKDNNLELEQKNLFIQIKKHINSVENIDIDSLETFFRVFTIKDRAAVNFVFN